MKKLYNKQDIYKNELVRPVLSKGFTLVELIVVITILAVLGTIAIMAFSGYSKNARDSARVSDLTNIKKTLELWIMQAGTYPNPSESEDITFSGGLVWTQGTFGESVFQTVGKLDKKPTDPLFGVDYTYSVTSTKKEYELGAVLEKSLGYSNPIVTQTYAADPVKAYVMGSYNGLIATINATPSYIIALPSIVLSDIETITNRELNTMDANTLVIETKSNLPASYNGIGLTMNGGDFSFNPVVVWSGATLALLNNQTEFQKFVVKLQDAYQGNEAFTNLPDYASIANETDASETAMKYAKNIIEASTKKTLTDVSTIPSFACASELGYTHASFNAGIATGVNQAWQNANPSTPCYYACTGGYSGSDCSVLLSCAEQPNYTNTEFTPGTATQTNEAWQNTNASNACYYACTGGYSGNDCSIPPSPITITFSNPNNEIVACSLCTTYNP